MTQRLTGVAGTQPSHSPRRRPGEGLRRRGTGSELLISAKPVRLSIPFHNLPPLSRASTLHMSAIAPQIFKDAETLGRTFAERLLVLIAQAKAEDRPFLLGCPGGRSPRPVYQAMGRALAKRPRDLSHVVI